MGRLTLDQKIRVWARTLEDAQIEDPLQESRTILQRVSGMAVAQQILNAQSLLPEQLEQDMDRVILRRSQREPLSHILGKSVFYGHEFLIPDSGLSPRPETELMVELSLQILASMREETHCRYLRIGEFCCGSGAPGLSLLYDVLYRQRKEAHLVLSDINPEALRVCQKNAEYLEVEEHCQWMLADLCPDFVGQKPLDLLMVNPPYIPTGELSGLMPEVKDYESPLCLDGGLDGLNFYRRLSNETPAWIKEGGWLVMEHGYDQRAAIKELFAKSDLWNRDNIREIRDYNSLDRIVAFQKRRT